jgi:hypothetical protein
LLRPFDVGCDALSSFRFATRETPTQVSDVLIRHISPSVTHSNGEAQRSIILADTAATSGRAQLAEGGPTSARKVNAKLREVEKTSAPKPRAMLPTLDVKYSYSFKSEFAEC